MKRYLIAVICVIVISALGPALDWAKAVTNQPLDVGQSSAKFNELAFDQGRQ